MLSAPPDFIMNLWFHFDFHQFRAPSVKSLTGNDAILVSGYHPDIYPDNLLSDKRISG